VHSLWTRCAACEFELYHPIVDLSVSSLGLYDDRRFPGRCILACHEHCEHFEDLEPASTTAFVSDMQRAARAIRDVTGADRVNLAILGNAAPHLHAHLVPRLRDTDPVPTRSPWSHPDPVSALEPRHRSELIEAIRKVFERA